MKRKSLYFIAPEKVETREEELTSPAEGEVQIETRVSAVSAGTELLVYRGEAPQKLSADATLPALKGNLAFPLKYGYSAIGTVISGQRDWIGKRMFAFNPHETAFNSSTGDLLQVPENLADEDACFLPHAETAVNLIMDGSPRLGENVVVLGLGIVGLLTTSLLSKHPLGNLITFDKYALRREWSTQLGAPQNFSSAAIGEAKTALGARGADLVYELTGHPEAINSAIELVGENGRIVVGSWYGNRKANLALGEQFHRGRTKIISSQVSHIEPELSGRWDRNRRFEQAWKLLAEVCPSKLITHRYPLAEAAKAFQQLVKNPENTLGVVLTYGTS